MYDNASLERPEVLIQHLEAGMAYIATVTALNKKVTCHLSSCHSTSASCISTLTSRHLSCASHLPTLTPHLSTLTSHLQGASLSVHKMVETLQKPELQLVEEKIEDAEELTQV